MTLTRKEKLLIYCLGRETTPYEAAKQWGEDVLGPWYACKTELLNIGLIKEGEQTGRTKPITTNISAFFDSMFIDNKTKKLFSYMLRKYVMSTFKKHIKKIIDFTLEADKKLEKEYGSGFYTDNYSRADILLAFMLVSLWSCEKKRLKRMWKNNNFEKTYDQLMILTQGDADFEDFPKKFEWSELSKWGFSFWLPMIREIFTESERKELCVHNLLAKSKKRIKKFVLLIYELLPEKAYKNYALSQVKSTLKVENSIFTETVVV